MALKRIKKSLKVKRRHIRRVGRRVDKNKGADGRTGAPKRKGRGRKAIAGG